MKPSGRPVLLLDFDHTLYPTTLPTLKAVDDRITLYIQTFLGLPFEEADRTRLRFCEEYGTTLRGLELRHGVERSHYCDFIHAIEAEHLPPPDPALHAWLRKVPHPCYIFTNARMDWAVRGLRSMGLQGILPEAGPGIYPEMGGMGGTGGTGGRDGMYGAPGADLRLAVPVEDASGEREAAPPWTGPRLHGILDIEFMEWQGKPHADAYAKADRMLRQRHGDDIRVVFADDRPDNLMAAKEVRWSTWWITPEPHRPGPFAWSFDRVAASLLDLDPESLA